MSVYRTDESVKYIVNLNQTDNAFYADCSKAIIGGEEKLLHNEVGVSFIIDNNEIHVTSGWHIGTEDFEFSENDGDDCNAYVEYYHPGLLKQIKAMVAA